MALAAFATIIDAHGRVLLVQRRDLDVWECPGGGVEDGETPWEAVAREVREEAGVDVLPTQLAGLYWRPEKKVIVLQFLCRVAGGTPHMTEEAAQVDWFGPDDLPERLAPVVRERIKDSLTAPGTFRTQEGPGAREFITSLS